MFYHHQHPHDPSSLALPPSYKRLCSKVLRAYTATERIPNYTSCSTSLFMVSTSDESWLFEFRIFSFFSLFFISFIFLCHVMSPPPSYLSFSSPFFLFFVFNSCSSYTVNSEHIIFNVFQLFSLQI